jgi:uncharacterized protein YecA (UPF0149 family)
MGHAHHFLSRLDRLARPQVELALALYRDDERQPAPRPTGPTRNGLCPCGSGKKYERCCAAAETT